MLGLEDASLGVFCPCVCKHHGLIAIQAVPVFQKIKSALVSFLLDENQLLIHISFKQIVRKSLVFLVMRCS